jgi:hypothetical protein
MAPAILVAYLINARRSAMGYSTERFLARTGAVRAVTLGAIALAVVAVGGAYAATAGAGGSRTIKVCVKHSGGVLYQARRCKRHDTKLSWNARGVAGPQGSAGPRGVTGPVGPSVAFGGAAQKTQDLAVDPSETTIQSVTVPAGSYVVNSNVAVSSSATAVRDTICVLSTPSQVLDDAQTFLAQNDAAGSAETLPINATVSLPVQATVSLDCSVLSGSGADVESSWSSLILTQVGSVQGSG